MAKTRKIVKPGKTKKPRHLPVCTAMVICDQVVIGEDKTATVIRIVDTVRVAPDELRKPGIPVQFGSISLFVALKNDKAKGDYELDIFSLDPIKKRSLIGTGKFKLEGPPESGSNMVNPVRIVWGGEGLYWIELRINKKLIAKTPLKVKAGVVNLSAK